MLLTYPTMTHAYLHPQVLLPQSTSSPISSPPPTTPAPLSHLSSSHYPARAPPSPRPTPHSRRLPAALAGAHRWAPLRPSTPRLLWRRRARRKSSWSTRALPPLASPWRGPRARHGPTSMRAPPSGLRQLSPSVQTRGHWPPMHWASCDSRRVVTFNLIFIEQCSSPCSIKGALTLVGDCRALAPIG